MAGNASLGFWTNVNDGQNHETLSVAVETETGKVITFTIRDRESLETLARIHVPMDAAMTIGQALMMAASMKAQEAAG